LGKARRGLWYIPLSRKPIPIQLDEYSEKRIAIVLRYFQDIPTHAEMWQFQQIVLISFGPYNWRKGKEGDIILPIF
jgi:hypothetical protein